MINNISSNSTTFVPPVLAGAITTSIAMTTPCDVGSQRMICCATATSRNQLLSALPPTAAFTYVTVAGSSLPIKREVKSIGGTLDNQLQFDSHARAVAKACAYHTHALHHVRHLLTSELDTTIACSNVATRIDYRILVALTATFDVLQRVQNILSRVVTQSARRSSAKPLLESLHWLPVRQRVTYNLATVCYKAQRIFSHCSYHTFPLDYCGQATHRG